MSIGNNIYKLRTSKNLSQGELADQLDVSRQSVSKWETDAAVPDLDKLMKLCDVFDISLDELTGRNTNLEKAENTTSTIEKTSSAQKIIGYILFGFSLLLGLVTLIFGNQKGDYLILIPTTLSLLICSLLCLFARKRAFYWCIWTAFAPISILSPYIVGWSILSTMIVVISIAIIIMCFVANVVFNDVIIQTSFKKTIILFLLWFLPVGLFAFHICVLTRPMPPIFAYNALFSMLLNFITYVLIALLKSYTVCYIKNLRK